MKQLDIYDKSDYCINKTFTQCTRTHKGIYGIIRKDNKILVIRKKRGPYTGMFDLPGGSPESGENEQQTLAREIFEETGCKLVLASNRQEKQVFYNRFYEDDGRPGCLHHTGILFNCIIEGFPDDKISDLDSDGALWIEEQKINNDNATPLVIYSINHS